MQLKVKDAGIEHTTNKLDVFDVGARHGVNHLFRADGKWYDSQTGEERTRWVLMRSFVPPGDYPLLPQAVRSLWNQADPYTPPQVTIEVDVAHLVPPSEPWQNVLRGTYRRRLYLSVNGGAWYAAAVDPQSLYGDYATYVVPNFTQWPCSLRAREQYFNEAGGGPLGWETDPVQVVQPGLTTSTPANLSASLLFFDTGTRRGTVGVSWNNVVWSRLEMQVVSNGVVQDELVLPAGTTHYEFTGSENERVHVRLRHNEVSAGTGPWAQSNEVRVTDL